MLTNWLNGDSHERDYTYETFADTLVRDLDLPESFRKRIASQIEAQVEKGKRSLPWHEAVSAAESLHPIFINIRINDTILIDRFEVRAICCCLIRSYDQSVEESVAPTGQC